MSRLYSVCMNFIVKVSVSCSKMSCNKTLDLGIV